jgi:hypothetical protein
LSNDSEKIGLTGSSFKNWERYRPERKFASHGIDQRYPNSSKCSFLPFQTVNDSRESISCPENGKKRTNSFVQQYACEQLQPAVRQLAAKAFRAKAFRAS